MLNISLKKKVLLFLPPYEGKVFGPPLGLLSLAASMREKGFEARIVDGALRPDYLAAIAEEIDDCLAFGVSLLTGPMIRDAISASRFVRCLHPNCPIIFGGWHPSLLTAETLREDYVDIVVRHQGEQTLVEILQRLASGTGLDLVAGCWFKRHGRIISNPDRPPAALHSLPSPAYDMIDFDAYSAVSGQRKLPYATSIGCPYACNYCTDSVFYNRRFNPQEVQSVVKEITDLVSKHHLTDVALVDSNFLVDTRRAAAIAQGFVEAGLPFKWTFQASTDLLCRMSDEDVELLSRSGVSHIGFGTESGSVEVLKRMNKPHQHVSDMFEAARKCALAKIRVTFNPFGYPGEEEVHRKETLRVMGDIANQYPNVSFSPNLFTPYPGIPIWQELRDLGLQEPNSLEAWSEVGLGSLALPWLDGRSMLALRRSMSFFILDNQLNRTQRRSESPVTRSVVRLLRRPLHWRLRHYYFQLPFELWFSRAKEWLTIRRSLLTGEALSRSLEQATK